VSPGRSGHTHECRDTGAAGPSMAMWDIYGGDGAAADGGGGPHSTGRHTLHTAQGVFTVDAHGRQWRPPQPSVAAAAEHSRARGVKRLESLPSAASRAKRPAGWRAAGGDRSSEHSQRRPPQLGRHQQLRSLRTALDGVQGLIAAHLAGSAPEGGCSLAVVMRSAHDANATLVHALEQHDLRCADTPAITSSSSSSAAAAPSSSEGVEDGDDSSDDVMVVGVSTAEQRSAAAKLQAVDLSAAASPVQEPHAGSTHAGGAADAGHHQDSAACLEAVLRDILSNMAKGKNFESMTLRLLRRKLSATLCQDMEPHKAIVRRLVDEIMRQRGC
jgi:hypothetical protein